MGANESRESSRTNEEGLSENSGMPNAGVAAGANNESRENSRTDEKRSSENDVVSHVAIAAAAAAGVALLAWGLSGTFSGNSGKLIKVNTDGSCRGIDSKIAAGGLLRDEDGAWIKGYTFNIGNIGTVQEAELCGILKGLSLAWENGFKKVRVECDSETAVKLVNNSQLRVKHRHFQLITDCKDLMSKSWDCVVTHVYREKNKAADHLAGISFHYELGYHELNSPPSSLERFLVDDKARVAPSRAVPADMSWA